MQISSIIAVYATSNGSQTELIEYDELVIHESFQNHYMHGHVSFENAGTESNKFIGGEILYIQIESTEYEEAVVEQTVQVSQEQDFSRVQQQEFEDNIRNQTTNKLSNLFVVYAKTNEKVKPNGTRSVRLLFCSIEMLSALSKNLCFAWTDSFSNIIANIINDPQNGMLTRNRIVNKELIVDSSVDTVNFLAPNDSIEKTINNILALAVDGDGYPFVFYEDNRGFNFRSIKTLLEDYNEDFQLSLSNIPQVLGQQEVTPIDIALLNINRSFDWYSSINQGVLASSINLVNLYENSSTNPSITSYNLNDTDVFEQLEANQTFITNNFAFFEANQNSTSRGLITTIPVSSFTYMQDFAEKVAKKRIAEFVLSSTCVIEFMMHSTDFIHRLGSCLNIHFDSTALPADDSNDETVDSNSYLNGRFLITKTTHIIRKREALPKYHQVIQACKFGYEGQI